MNSKNLSKAINRVLAILLTAAMVAGSFTVPVKAEEMSEPAVAESTTDDAAGTSDGVAEDVVKETSESVVGNNTSTGEETSEETGEESTAALEITEEGVENPDGEVVNNGIYLDLGLTDAEIAAFSKVYDAKAITTNDIFGASNAKIKVYTDSTKASQLSVSPVITYWKKTADGWDKLTASYMNATVGGTVDSHTVVASDQILNANTYKVEVEAYDEVSRGTAEASFEIVISKCNVTNWKLGAGSDTPTDAAYNDMGTLAVEFKTVDNAGTKYTTISGTAPIYTVGDTGRKYTDAQGNEKSIYAALPVDASEVNVIKYTRPANGKHKSGSTETDSKKDLLADFLTAMGSSSGINNTKADFTLKDGKGDNNIYNATVNDSSKDWTADDDRPYVEVKLTGLNNYEGTLKVPFTIGTAAVANAIVSADAADLVESVDLDGTTAKEVTIDVNNLIPTSKVSGVKRITDEEGNYKKAVIKDVTCETTDRNNFFYMDRDDSTKLEYTVEGKGTDNAKVKFTVAKNATGSAVIAFTITPRDYDAPSAINLTVNVVDGSPTEGACTIVLQDSATAVADTIYDASTKPSIKVLVTDDSGQGALGSNQYESGVTLRTYIYKAKGITPETYEFVESNLETVSIVADDSSPKKGKATVTSKSVLEPGTYKAKIIYDSKCKPATVDVISHAVAEFGFKVVDNKGRFLVADHSGVTKNATDGCIEAKMTPNGAVLDGTMIDVSIVSTDKNLNPITGAAAVAVANLEVDEDYVITAKGPTNVPYSLVDGVKEIKDAFPDETWDTGGDDAAKLTYNLGIIKTNANGKFDGYIVSGVTAIRTDGEEVPVLKKQPYVEIKVKADGKGAERFKDTALVNVVYDIKGGDASKNTDTAVTDTWTTKVPTTKREITFDLTHAYTLPGHVATTNEKYADDLITGWELDNTTGSDSGATAQYYTCSSTASTFTIKMKGDVPAGKKLNCNIKPVFKANTYYTESGNIPLVVNFKTPGNIEISIDNNAYTDGEIIYSGAAKVGTGGAAITTALKSGTTTLDQTSGNFTNKIYRLASQVESSLVTNDLLTEITYNGNQGGTAGVYTQSINNTAISAATDAGTYLIVSEYTGIGAYYAEAEKYYKPFTIVPFNLSTKKVEDADVTVTLANDSGSGYTAGDITYKTGTNYKALVGQKEGTPTSLLSAFNITGIKSNNNLAETTDYDLSFNSMKAPATEGGDYTIPVTIVGKGNFTGSINAGSFTVKPTAITASLVIAKPDTFKYDGEDHIPTMYIQINGNKYLYKGADTELPDPYMTASITYANNATSDADKLTKNAGQVTATLTLGGLYTTGAPVTGDYNITAGDNNVIADIPDIVVDINTSATSVKATLPTSVADAKDATKKYEISYGTTTSAGVAVKGSGTVAAGTINGNVYTGSISGTLAIGDEYTVTIPAKITNYADKSVVVRVKVHDVSKEICVNTLAVAGKAYDRKAMSASDVTVTSIKEGGSGGTVVATSVTAPLPEGRGSISLDWYKKDSSTNIYEKINVSDTINAGDYKVVATLVNGGDYWMTPTEATFTRGKFAIQAANVESVVVDGSNIVYDGTAKAPKITITLKTVGTDEHVVIDQEKDVAITFTGSTTELTEAGEKDYTFGTALGNYDGFTDVYSKMTTEQKKFTILPKPLDLSLTDVTVGVDAEKGAVAVTYDDMKAYEDEDVVAQLATGQIFDNSMVDIKITDAWDLDGNEKAVPSDLKVFGKTGKYRIMVSSLKTQTVKASGTDKTENYEVSGLSAKGILTVKEPEKITVSSEVKVGDKVVTDKKKLVKPEKAVEVTAIVTDETNKKTLVKDTDYSVIVKDKNSTVTSVFALGKYTITIESINTAFTFDPIEMEIEVVDSIPVEVKEFKVNPDKMTLSLGKSNTAILTFTGTKDDEKTPSSLIGELYTEVSVYSDPTGIVTVDATPDSTGKIKVTANATTEGKTTVKIAYGDSTAEIAVSVVKIEADPGTPIDDPSDYEKPGEDEERGLQKDIEKIITEATAPKTTPKFTGKPVEAKITVKSSEKLVAGTDYKITYADNINATTKDEPAIAIISGIGTYYGYKEVPFQIAKKKISGTIVAGTLRNVIDGNPDGGDIAEAISVYDGKTYLYYGEDYTIDDNSISVNNKGVCSFEVTYTGNYEGKKKGTVKLASGDKDIALFDVGVTFGADDNVYATYTGSQITVKNTMKITAKDGETDIPYTVSYKNNTNVGWGSVTLKAKKPYTGSVVIPFEIKADKDTKVFEEKDIVVKSATYTGKLLKPGVTVMSPITGKKLVKNKDYVLYYGAELNAPEGYVVVRFIGDYAEYEDETRTFVINKAEFKKTAVKKVNGASALTFNGKALVNETDFIVSNLTEDGKVPYDTKSKKYTIELKVAPESGNFQDTAKKTTVKTIKAKGKDINWKLLGLDDPEAK